MFWRLTICPWCSNGLFLVRLGQTGTAVVIVPVGATEQHGPNGLIGTDHITAEVCVQQCCVWTSECKIFAGVPT